MMNSPQLPIPSHHFWVDLLLHPLTRGAFIIDDFLRNPNFSDQTKNLLVIKSFTFHLSFFQMSKTGFKRRLLSTGLIHTYVG